MTRGVLRSQEAVNLPARLGRFLLVPLYTHTALPLIGNSRRQPIATPTFRLRDELSQRRLDRDIMAATMNSEEMQQRISTARRDAETLKDRIKRKKDELSDTNRKNSLPAFFKE